MTPEPTGQPASAPQATRALQIDLTRRRQLLAALGGNHVRFCYQCGACVGDCPSARFDPAFNPREIMLTALLGALDDLLAPGAVVWKCSNCYSCYERCPQDVRPVEVILALKNLAREAGNQPAAVTGVVEMIVKTGRSAPMLATLARKREAMGLPPIAPVAVDELQALLAPDEDARGGAR
jgi:heterodisulfide reductase subunit C2